ncbi:hypothetical protein A0H81_10771 [Grifola frondosa]|uniref:Uncharacterized protein n=1 Tax=Grifola frondosa TaxID=5627 RepID=A0A1C7LX15_GRIFR|nr:hypothetical protein A0H81_10771 [Grifola frondosa]
MGDQCYAKADAKGDAKAGSSLGVPQVALPPRDMDAQPHPRLILSHLLHPQSWDLPEWNGPHVNDPLRIIDKVDDLDSSLALLQRYRNSLRPIHRLSPISSRSSS